eukprot:TRINITY_DN79583_c0_g1_i1.p1 TRINITY_DN79583_c0_g1~~TRINITY_DN79583_c0_g1_i1.p1  ORF type:complete len:428 (-),score=96.09 TRINITY_DN79583_c0_g1_i1:71-1354(-)
MVTGKTLSFTPDLVYRDYRDSDDDQCKALEMRAMQGTRFPALQKFTRLFIRAGFEHFVTFDAKAKQYEDCIIRVVEDKASGGRVIGVGCATLKTARIHSQMCKVAYVFDLRVDEDYQGHGVGRTLTAQIEEACESRGAKFLYLTVNRDNTKAKSLYAKRGFVHASDRDPAMSLLAQPEEEQLEEGITVELMSKEEALHLTKEAYCAADLFLQRPEELFGSKLYEGTWVARRGSSLAAVSTWNGSSLTGFRIERLLLPMTWWRLRITHALCASCAAYTSWRWMCILQSAQAQARESQSFFDAALLLLVSGLTASSFYLVWRSWDVLKFIAGKLLSDDTKLRHRLFGPFASGPEDEQEALMRAVLRRVHNIARESGYAMTICNMDKGHPLRKYFPSNKFSTTFLYKQVGGHSETLPPLSVDNFFDPRDL